MNRTSAFLAAALGLALVALVLYLPQNLAAAAPPPAPSPQVHGVMPTPPAPAPVVVAQHAGSLSLDGKLTHPYVLPGTNDVFLALEVKAVDVPGAARAPVNLALVIDRSGSMSGEKIIRAREAALALLEKLGPQDRLSVVHYGSDVSVLPGAFVTEGNRVRFERFIRGISEEGGTNIGDGLAAGRAQLAKAQSDFKVNRLVLLSDGQPTVGITSPAALTALVRGYRSAGLSVTSLGVGVDFNEDLMTRLAEVGGGSYGFVARGAQLAQLFERDLQQAGTQVARAVTLSFELPPGVQLGEVLGRTASVSGNRVTVAMPDFSARQIEQLVVRVRASGGVAGSTLPIAALNLDYEDLLEARRNSAALALSAMVTTEVAEVQRRRDPLALVQATRARTAENTKKAADYIAAGDTGRAEKALKDNEVLFDDVSAVAGAPAVAADRKANAEAFGLTNAAPSMPQEQRALGTKALKAQSLRSSGWGASAY